MESVDTDRELMNRPHWQRSEAMVFFTEIAERLFPAINESIDDEELLEIVGQDFCPSAIEAYELGNLFQVKGLQLVSEREREYSRLNMLGEKSSLARHISTYTYHGEYNYTLGVVGESIATMTSFPINIIRLLYRDPIVGDSVRQQYSEESLRSYSEILKSEWFHEMIDIAATTSNGVWGSFSTTRASDKEIETYLPGWFKEMPVFELSENGLQFSAKAVANLKLRLRRSRQEANKLEPRLDISSSGCPVRHKRPVFTSDYHDQRSLAELSELFGKSPEELTRTRERTAIDLGLDTLADLFERAADLKGTA